MEPEANTIEILRKIHAEIATSNARLEKLEVATASGFAGLRQEMGGLRQETGGLRQEMGGLRQEIRTEFAELRQDVRRLEGKVATTNETLGLIHSRLLFAEAASAAATAGRVRLDDRVDRLETRVDALEARDKPDDD